MQTSVLLDTCVLYPAYLRDTILRLANTGLIRPLWSEKILTELERNLATRVGDERAASIVDLMREHFPDAIVTGHEKLIAQMTNHRKDRHVLAAAVHAEADAIVTFNLADFEDRHTQAYGTAAIDPDAFLLDRMRSAPTMFVRTLQDQVDGYQNPKMSVLDLASALERCGCEAVAGAIHRRSRNEDVLFRDHEAGGKID